jgi:ferredoxin
MADPKGFLTTNRELPKRRPVDVRIKDWKEVYQEQEFSHLQKQAGRCMDCGIPFCHQGCPLGNLIPEWNDLIWRGEKQRRSIACMQQIIFQNLLADYAQPHVRQHAWWQLTQRL